MTDQVSFTCPRCGATSYNPNDAREGYCGRCQDWTGDRGRFHPLLLAASRAWRARLANDAEFRWRFTLYSSMLEFTEQAARRVGIPRSQCHALLDDMVTMIMVGVDTEELVRTMLERDQRINLEGLAPALSPEAPAPGDGDPAGRRPAG